MPYLVQSLEEEDNKTNILDHWGEEYRARVQTIIDRHHNLFRAELGKFNDDVKMSMSFVDENNVTGLKQAPYSLIARDRKAIDNILDSLMRQGRLQKVPLGTILLAASLAFVVWKNDKPRVVVDLRKINTWLYLDAYPLSRQDTILGALGEAMIFSFVDLTKSFF